MTYRATLLPCYSDLLHRGKGFGSLIEQFGSLKERFESLKAWFGSLIERYGGVIERYESLRPCIYSAEPSNDTIALKRVGERYSLRMVYSV